jgi:hypothetical protein
MRLLTKFTIFFVILLMLIPLETYAVEKTVTNQNTTKEKLVGKLPEANVKLYATEKDGELTNFKLQIGRNTLSFPKWMNVSNETYYPQLYYSDINDDRKKEIIIVLTTGYGSEVKIQEVHVFNKNNNEFFEEKYVDNPISIINKIVKTKLTKSEAIITVGNKTTKINIKKLGIEPTHIFPNISFGSILKFEVINNKLNAVVGATISPSGGYLGDIYITYTFKDNMYQAEQIRFVSAVN